MAAYVTAEEIAAFAFQADVSADLDKFALLAGYCSRLFDDVTDVAHGFFAAETVAGARTFYGDGTDRLLVGPHVAASVTAVTLPAGYSAVGAQFVDRGDYLIRTFNGNILPLHASLFDLPYALVTPFSLTNYYGWPGALNAWPQGVPVTVTATYGEGGGVPDDIKAAVLAWALVLWRGIDPAKLPVTQEGTLPVFNQPMPPVTKLVAERYRQHAGPLAFA